MNWIDEYEENKICFRFHLDFLTVQAMKEYLLNERRSHYTRKPPMRFVCCGNDIYFTVGFYGSFEYIAFDRALYSELKKLVWDKRAHDIAEAYFAAQ